MFLRAPPFLAPLNFGSLVVGFGAVVQLFSGYPPSFLPSFLPSFHLFLISIIFVFFCPLQ